MSGITQSLAGRVSMQVLLPFSYHELAPSETQADSVEELREAVRDAVRCHFADESDSPRMIRLHFVRDEVIAA